ncbi:MAG: glycosyltransferase family 2 protein [Anaerolineales bacterium]
MVVVDDRSTDATLTQLREIASRVSHLILVNGSDLPDGWAGKPHALYQASAVARGEWLCFVDADTFLAPQAISSCYAKALETKADPGLVLGKGRHAFGDDRTLGWILTAQDQ